MGILEASGKVTEKDTVDRTQHAGCGPDMAAGSSQGLSSMRTVVVIERCYKLDCSTPQDEAVTHKTLAL